MTNRRIDYKKPRQKQWGIIENNSLVELPYGHTFDKDGKDIKFNSTNCYDYVLDQVHELLESGTRIEDIQVVEFVPYDFIMTPRV